MPYCEECGKWVPPENPDESLMHEWLRVAYHATNCPGRLYDEWGYLDGYIFQGDILYEVQPGGKWVAVSTFRTFPKPLDPSARMPEIPDVVVEFSELERTEPEVASKRIAIESYTWEEWIKKYPAYSKNAERQLVKAAEGNSANTNHQRNYSTHSSYNYTTYKPEPKYFDEIDKAKWPNTWKWSFKFFYAVDFNRNTRYRYKREAYFSHGYRGPYGSMD